jgi:anti-sigma B factor antagonist
VTAPSRFSVRHDGTLATVVPTGELDVAIASELTACLARMMAAGLRNIVIDLRATSFMDCTCLRILLNAHTWLAASGGYVALTGVPPQIERLLALTGLEAALPRAPEASLSESARRMAQ